MADPDTNEVKQLLADLRGMSKEKRRTAVMRLGMIGGDQAVRALMEAVQNEHEDLIVRGRSALMLGKLKDQRAVDPLIRALEAPGFQTPLFAAEALGKLGDTRAIKPLLDLAAECNDKTHDAAMEALRKLGYMAVHGREGVMTEADTEVAVNHTSHLSDDEADRPSFARNGNRPDFDMGMQDHDFDPVFQP
jgi:hypothetical protein